MKKSFSLSIPNRCSEKWDNFTPTANGGYCGSCSKVVVDFTKMSDTEIISFFSNKPEHTCGRFKPGQLKSYAEITAPKINPGLTLFKAGLMSLLFLLISKQTSAQEPAAKSNIEIVDQHIQRTQENITTSNQTITGLVKSQDDDSPMPGVNVLVKGSTYGTNTDAEGRFQLSDVKEGDVLVFSFIGYEMQEYTIRKDVADLGEIPMITMYYEIMGELAVDGVYEEPSALQKLWTKIKGIF